MRLSVPSTLLAVALVAPLATASDGPSQQDLRRAQRVLTKGDRALRAGNLSKAAEHYRRSLKIVPRLPEGLVGLGHVMLREGRFRQAYESFRRAADAYREFGDELFDLRSRHYRDAQMEAQAVRTRIQNMEAAINALQRELEFVRESPNAGQRKAQIAARIHSYQSRLASENRELNRLEQIEAPTGSGSDPVPGRLYFFIGNALLNLKRTAEAIRAWETCAEKSPDFPLVYNNLAVGYWQQNRLEDATRCVRRAEELGFRVNPDFKADLERGIAGRSTRASGR